MQKEIKKYEKKELIFHVKLLQEIQAFVNQYEDDIRSNIEEEEDQNNFGTENHECLAIIRQNGQRACGISLFRKGETIKCHFSRINQEQKKPNLKFADVKLLSRKFLPLNVNICKK